MGLGSKRPDGPLFRVGRSDDAWAPPDWAYAKEDGTFGNRFDDPEGHYRVLYASSRRLGCYIETLARFRVDLSFVAELKEMEDDEEDDFSAFGTLNRAWFAQRCIGIAEAFGDYADIYSLEWVSHLRSVLASTAMQLGMTDVDLGSLQRAEPRILTQRASREAFENRFDGIFYHSRYGQTIENWAIFEPFAIHDQKSEPIDEEDPELAEAMKILGLVLVD